MERRDFADLFRRATGHAPYAYQVELATSDPLPDVVVVPTGSGKTHALLTSWLFRRLHGAAPRRLVYALPMRTLVEQTRVIALEVRARLGLEAEALPIHVLMGGVEESAWREHPEQDQILIGTIDMLLSRALNRGYAESRFAWPVSFGVLNNDCRWVFDEVQLMGQARATSAQLDGLRSKLGTLQPCETLWASATMDRGALQTVDRPRLRRVLELPEADRRGPLAARLGAQKLLGRVDLSGESTASLPRAIADSVASRHLPGTRSLVVLNTVSRAQASAEQLRRRLEGTGVNVVLLHSRFRPPDRLAQMREATREVDPNEPGTIVVATQVVEAGIDLSSRLLATETAPFSSIIQRLGRCNRAGEHADGTVLWLDSGDIEESRRGVKAAAPYLPSDLNATREALAERVGSSLSPSVLERMLVSETREEPTTLRRRDLLDLFDTTPDLSGLDVDVAPFIRADSDRSVSVFFRELPDRPGASLPASEQPAPGRDELVSVPLSQLGDRDRWLFDHVDGVWLRARANAVPPGATVLLAAAAGGYTPGEGWNPVKKVRVTPNGPASEELAESLDADPGSFGKRPQELAYPLASSPSRRQSGQSEPCPSLSRCGSSSNRCRYTRGLSSAMVNSPSTVGRLQGVRAALGRKPTLSRSDFTSAVTRSPRT